MAAIDKIYVNSYEKYIAFKNWCEEQPPIVDKYGTKCRISDYLITGWDKDNFKSHPVFNAPYYVDAYVIKNCPLDFIQKELKFNYCSTYEQIKEGKLYNSPARKNTVAGKHLKCIQHPQTKYNTPFMYKSWDISVTLPDGDYMWYHSKTNSWDYCDEFVIANWSSSVACANTIKAVKRLIRKWCLPVGTKVEVEGRYVEDTYVFIVKP